VTVCVRSTAARMGEYAVRYALRRAGYAPTEIRVLDSEQNVIEVVPAEDGRALESGGLEFRNSGRKRRNAPVTVAALTMRPCCGAQSC
jgi:hypothetical protein